MLINRKISINVVGNTEEDIKKATAEACDLLIHGCISGVKRREGYSFEISSVGCNDNVPMTEKDAKLYTTARFSDETRLRHHKRLPYTPVIVRFERMGQRADQPKKEPMFKVYGGKSAFSGFGLFFASELTDFGL